MHRYGRPLILKEGQHPPERHRLLPFTISNARSNSVLSGGQHGPEYPPPKLSLISLKRWLNFSSASWSGIAFYDAAENALIYKSLNSVGTSLANV